MPVQKWGLQVKDLLSSVVVTGRSSANAKVKLYLNVGASADENALVAAASPIPGTQINAVLPQTVTGSAVGTNYPYFQVVIGVLDNAVPAATEQYVDCDIYVGGKPF
ncbi:MAG: hypothetical protein V4850_01305 [Myxococcota bacterium]